MARASGSKDYISLVNGLITEASPLNFPENSTTDELNFLLELDGLTRSRRKGLANKVNNFSQTRGTSSRTQFEDVLYWEEPNVILFVYRESEPTAKTVLLIHKNNSTYDFVDSYELSSTESAAVELSANTSFVSITTGNSSKPILLEFDEQSGQILINTVDLFIRDFELLDDDLQISGRPSTLSDEHKYNLYNAGWYAYRRLESTGELGDPVEEFAANTATRSIAATFVANNTIEGLEDLSLGTLQSGDSITISGSVSNDGTYTVSSTQVYSSAPQLVRIITQETTIVNEPSVTVNLGIPQEYPSNADISLLGVKSDSNGVELFSADTLNEVILGNSEAPRGHYVYNINSFDRNTRVASRFTDGTSDSTLTLVKTVTL